MRPTRPDPILHNKDVIFLYHLSYLKRAKEMEPTQESHNSYNNANGTFVTN